ncbi:MAG: 7-carboxy-7-deazaguanine synthase QueE [Bacteroidales bacterium]
MIKPDNATQYTKELPIVEEFYTIQGEGIQTGRAAYFVRIGGCDVACSWCDTKESWNFLLWPPRKVEDVVNRVVESGADSVVVTGGEPLSWDLDYLCLKLREKNILTFLETSGSQPLSGVWDWICVSPKKNSPPLPELLTMAHELKVIIHDVSDFAWAEENAGKVRKECHLLLQPEWSKHEQMTPLVVDYIKKYPRWRLSLQTHKFIKIP